MGNGNKVEMLIAICAVLTSAIAVFIAWDQGRVMRAQQHGAVYPVVQIEGFVSSSPEMVSMGLRISNSGVGPALIERVDVSKGGVPVKSLTPYADKFPSGYQQSWSSLIGRAIAPGKEVIPLRVDWSRERVSVADRDAAALAWSALDGESCYCSVFNKCWTATGLNMGTTMSRAEPVKRCERSDEDVFEALANYVPKPETDMTAEVE